MGRSRASFRRGPARRSLPLHHHAGLGARQGERRMKYILPIFKREFAAYFATPLAYVFIVIFLLAMGAFTFYVGRFFDNGVADLSCSLAITLGSIFSWCPQSPCACGPRNAAPVPWS